MSIDSQDKVESTSKDSKQFLKPQYQGTVPALVPFAKSFQNSESISNDINKNYENAEAQQPANNETFNPVNAIMSTNLLEEKRVTEPENQYYKINMFVSDQKKIETHRINA